jgi:hypothetical protein
MSVDEVVTRYAGSPSGARPVVFLPGAEGVGGRLSGASPMETAAEAPSRVVVDLAQRGEEAAGVERLAGHLGGRDVGVLVLVSAPELVPAGPVVAALGGAGLRVVQAEGMVSREGRTVLAFTADPSVPQVSYLLGHAVPEGDAARLRQANEWAVEGLQLRALAATTADQLAGAREEAAVLRVERDALETRLAAERARLQAEVDTLARANRALRAQRDMTTGAKVKKAVRILMEDPLGGAKRLARAAARRLRR